MALRTLFQCTVLTSWIMFSLYESVVSRVVGAFDLCVQNFCCALSPRPYCFYKCRFCIRTVIGQTYSVIPNFEKVQGNSYSRARKRP